MSMLEDIKLQKRLLMNMKKEKTQLPARFCAMPRKKPGRKRTPSWQRPGEAAQKTVSEAEAKAHKEADAFVARKAEEDRQKAEAARARLDNAVKYIMEKVVIEC